MKIEDSLYAKAHEVVLNNFHTKSRSEFKAWIKTNPMYAAVWKDIRHQTGRINRAAKSAPSRWFDWVVNDDLVGPIFWGIATALAGGVTVLGVQNTVYRRRSQKAEKQAAVEAETRAEAISDPESNVIAM